LDEANLLAVGVEGIGLGIHRQAGLMGQFRGHALQMGGGSDPDWRGKFGHGVIILRLSIVSAGDVFRLDL
jgi:hypothetical protein